MKDYEQLVNDLRHADNLTADHKLLGVCARAAAAIEELQAQLMYATDAAKEIAEKVPKRGEWKPFDLTYGRSIYSCSVCEQATEVPVCMEKPMYAYCPNCGAKMEVQDESAGSL